MLSTPWRFFFAVGLIVLSFAPAIGQESATYSMTRVGVTAVGESASSSNFDTTVVLGQESPSGAASFCNQGFTGSFGFWSIQGDLNVPQVLRLNKSAEDPQTVELRWSGNRDSFEVHRSATSHDVKDSLNILAVTALCELSDPDASQFDLVFYNVIPQ